MSEYPQKCVYERQRERERGEKEKEREGERKSTQWVKHYHVRKCWVDLESFIFAARLETGAVKISLFLRLDICIFPLSRVIYEQRRVGRPNYFAIAVDVKTQKTELHPNFAVRKCVSVCAQLFQVFNALSKRTTMRVLV